MKKKVLFVASLFLATITFAQDGLTSKKGEAYLPEAGDLSIGFDAAPWLQYAGDFLGGNVNNTAGANLNSWYSGVPTQTISLKYFKDESTAYRIKVRLGFGSTSSSTLTDTSLVANGGQGKPEDMGSYVEDVVKTSYNNIVIGGGIEKRRGNTRIQGIYGGELLISLGGSKTTYEYGVPMNDKTTGYTVVGTSRPLESKAGSTLGVTARGFIGVEVFVFPKTSISAEYGWGIGFSSTGEGTGVTEWFGLASSTATTPSTQQLNTKIGKSSSFGLDTDNTGGAVNINFYF